MRTSMMTLGRLVVAVSLALSACDRGAPPVESVKEDQGSARAANNAATIAERVPLIGAKIKGSDKALVTIVEFSDYACPFCKKAHATVETLLAEYDGRVRLAVFENPLPFHTTARSAAKWAFAAEQQGKYWEARNALFENQKQLDKDGLAALTKTLGLDPGRMERDQNSPVADAYVDVGLALAKLLGARGTPTFFVNGVRLVGARPVAEFRTAIDEALRTAERLVAKGIRPENVYSEILANAVAPQPEGKSPADSANPGGCDCDQGEECNGAATQDPKEMDIVDIQVGNAPVRGDANAPVTIVVFTDFECPFCAKAEQNLREIEKEYGRNVRVAYKSYPLAFHEHAGLAAKAALAAHRQGKFFEYRDALFAHQNALGRADLLQYASDLGLDSNRFEQDLDNKTLEAAIAADQTEANRLQVHGTPTFFVNGRRLAGAQPIAEFRTQIEAALTQR